MQITSHRYHDDFAGGHSGRRRFASGEVEVCCHRVKFQYEIGHCRLTPEDLTALEALAEERAREMINADYISGDLYANVPTPVRQMDREFFGWWSIVND